jgi:hypothetical protein
LSGKPPPKKHYFSANQGYNYRAEEVVMSEIKLDLPFMVPDFKGLMTQKINFSILFDLVIK